jgi:hypothetical protein
MHGDGDRPSRSLSLRRLLADVSTNPDPSSISGAMSRRRWRFRGLEVSRCENEADDRARGSGDPPRLPGRPGRADHVAGLWGGVVAGASIAAVMIGTYVVLLGPWQRRWGATNQELRRTLPGDELLRRDAPSTTRAITIDASPEDVFPWLLQIGYGQRWLVQLRLDRQRRQTEPGPDRPSSARARGR